MTLVACSQAPAAVPATAGPSVQEAIGTGIAQTQAAGQTLTEAAAQAIANTQAAQPTATESATATQVPPTATATPTQTPSATAAPTETASPVLPTATNTRRPVTPLPPTPTPTTPPPTAAPAVVVLDLYRTIKVLASLNDSQVVFCDDFVAAYGQIELLPATFDGIGEYETARAKVLDTSRDENLFCEAVLVGENTDNTIPFQQWGLSRQGTDQAIGLLRPVIEALGFTP